MSLALKSDILSDPNPPLKLIDDFAIRLARQNIQLTSTRIEDSKYSIEVRYFDAPIITVALLTISKENIRHAVSQIEKAINAKKAEWTERGAAAYEAAHRPWGPVDVTLYSGPTFLEKLANSSIPRPSPL